MNAMGATPTPGTVPVPDDREEIKRRLGEVQERIHSLEGQLQGVEASRDHYAKESATLIDTGNQIYNRIQPLANQHDRALKMEKIGRYAGMGSGYGMIPTMALAVGVAASGGILGPALVLADMVVVGASFLAVARARKVMGTAGPQFDAGYQTWKQNKAQLDAVQSQDSRAASSAASLQVGLKTARGQEQVLAMSLNLTIPEPPPEARVTTERDVVRIGNLKIPRRIE